MSNSFLGCTRVSEMNGLRGGGGGGGGAGGAGGGGGRDAVFKM